MKTIRSPLPPAGQTLTRLLALVLGAGLSFFGAGCAKVLGPEILITWKVPKPGLSQGVAVRYEAIQVGEVTAVRAAAGGVTARVRLDSKNAHYVRTKSAFLFQSAVGAGPAYVEVIALDKNAPPTDAGAHFRGAESRTEVGLAMITTDWKRTALFGAVGLGLILVLLLVVATLLKVWAVVTSLAAGAVSAVYFTPMVEAWLRTRLPESVRADLIAYALAFFAGSLVVSILLGVVLRPLRRK